MGDRGRAVGTGVGSGIRCGRGCRCARVAPRARRDGADADRRFVRFEGRSREQTTRTRRCRVCLCLYTSHSIPPRTCSCVTHKMGNDYCGIGISPSLAVAPGLRRRIGDETSHVDSRHRARRRGRRGRCLRAIPSRVHGTLREQRGDLTRATTSTSRRRRRHEIKGYAYAGGGRAVTSVEITLDDGCTWIETTLHRPCPPSTHGKHWGWTLWSYVASPRATRGALAGRARDDAGHVQPSALVWTPSGEKNNREYVVKLSLAATRANGPTYVACEHPVEIGGGGGDG